MSLRSRVRLFVRGSEQGNKITGCRGSGDLFSIISMLINDRIYGPVEIDEPVLLDLIDSASMQRL